MGHEIRRVPKGWEHPRDDNGRYKPMIDEYYGDVMDEWIRNHMLWEKGEYPDQKQFPEATSTSKFFADWNGGPPQIEFYNNNKWSESALICFQVYENISEGTPVSPVLDSIGEVEDWLVKHLGYSREEAVTLCIKEFEPSFILSEGKETRSIVFEDAQRLKLLHPNTFYAPEPEDLAKIAPGEIVKVCAFRERFWVEVLSVEGDHITGKVNNELLTQKLKYNDIVRFKANNVYNIWSIELEGLKNIRDKEVSKKLHKRKRP